MNIFCIAEFESEIKKLSRRKQYRGVESDIVDYFKDKNIDDLRSGTRLNASEITPFVKTRINGRGGFRLYYLLLLVKDDVYLSFIHPKTGEYGLASLPKKDSKHYLEITLAAIQKQNLFEVKMNFKKKTMIYTKVTPVKKVSAKKGKSN